MTHREQMIAMLDEAGISYGYSEGDCVISHDCIFRFYVDGRLKEIQSEPTEDYGDY